MVRRFLAGVAATAALLVVLAAPVVAGGWATIQADAGTPPTPNAGEPVTFGFTVLQHGVSPAGWVSPTVVLTDTATGTTVQAAAVKEGVDGHFVATLTVPTAGFYTWQVQMPDLVVETTPAPMTVLTATGATPAIDPATVGAAVERSVAEARRATDESVAATRAELQADIAVLRGNIARLGAERDALAARIGTLETSPAGVPALAIVSLAVLGGAAAGFAMAWLARRDDRAEIASKAGVLTTR
jgi:hypothetical protein